jgi:hypothetical protein
VSGSWSVDGYDTFEGGDAYYPVKRGLASEEDARAAASAYLHELERRQPSEHSGGQGPMGIQDRVFIVKPDGTRERFLRQTDGRDARDRAV